MQNIDAKCLMKLCQRLVAFACCPWKAIRRGVRLHAQGTRYTVPDVRLAQGIVVVKICNGILYNKM